MTVKEAIKVITYLQEQSIHNTVDGPIYIPKKYITTLEDLLISHQKQQKLLKLYKKLSDIVIYKDEFYDVKLDDWIDYYELEKVIKQIKELEK